MWTDILGPFAVVLFELLVFAITLYLAHTFTRSRDAEWEPLEPPPGTPAEVVLPAAKAPVRVEREPVGVA